MWREHFELDVRNIDWVESDEPPKQPLVRIHFDGPADELEDRLSGVNDERLTANETDVAFRLQEPLNENPEAAGVVGVTNRLTGDFILELNQEADDVLKFIRAAREYGRATNDRDARYRAEIFIDDEKIVAYDKGTFLVYDSDGQLLRSESLIPSGVEL